MSTSATKEQQDFIDCVLDPPATREINLFACPGAGKTYSLVQAVCALVRQDADAKIACITYTNAAADELRERLDLQLGALAYDVSVSTIHGFALKLGLSRPTRSCSPDDVQLLIDIYRDRLVGQYSSKQIWDARRSDKPNELTAMWARLDAFMRTSGVLDPDGILTEFAQTDLRPIGLTHIFIDEQQDCTADTELVVQRAAAAQNVRPLIIRVGDPAQQIFSFAGAADWEPIPASLTYRLTENFRSCEAIVRAASRRGLNASMRTSKPGGEVRAMIYETSHAEEQAIKDALLAAESESRPFALLCRSNDQRLKIEVLVRALGLRVNGETTDLGPEWWKFKLARRLIIGNRTDMHGLAIMRAAGKTINAMKRALMTSRTSGIPLVQGEGMVIDPPEPLPLALRRVFAYMGIGQPTTEHQELLDAADRELLEYEEERTTIVDDGFDVRTIHRAKGLEWNEVWIPAVDARWPSLGKEEKAAEERRIMHVAMTRARDRLTITGVEHPDVLKFLTGLNPEIEAPL